MGLKHILRGPVGFFNSCEEGWDQLGQIRHVVRGCLAFGCAGSCFADVGDDLDFSDRSLNQAYRRLIREVY